MQRASGILLHVTSLPGPHGVGDLGPGARRFLDWMQRARQGWWQVLPLGPVAAGNSPYASSSVRAGNPLLVSLELLEQDGLLSRQDVEPVATDVNRVDFDAVRAHHAPRLERAYQAFQAGRAPALRAPFQEFQHAARSWLPDHALFTALHAAQGHRPWNQWEPALARREPRALEAQRDALAAAVEQECLVQFLFARQWAALRAEARARGIRVLGDLPIHVALDSVDTWTHRHLFHLDDNGNPAAVTGVPPDGFCPEGQLWGHPLPDWRAMASEGFRWWVDRVRGLKDHVDVIRIDNFGGFLLTWAVPAEGKAAEGQWVRGPGRMVFNAVQRELGSVPFLAEDLGAATDEVDRLRRELGLPGMRVLQFAFDGDSMNPHLPRHHQVDCAVYTGTHDNDTTTGWLGTLHPSARRRLAETLGRWPTEGAWDVLRLAWQSLGFLAVAPLQDVLGLGRGARLNIPGTAQGNWTWRYRAEQLIPHLADRLAQLTQECGRVTNSWD